MAPADLRPETEEGIEEYIADQEAVSDALDAVSEETTPPEAETPPPPREADPPAEECEECECAACPPAGAPAWMATFADLMSLLVAFFVLILSFSDINVPKHKQITGSMKEAFGVQRLVPVVEPPKAMSIIAKEFSPTYSEPTIIQTVRQDTTDNPREVVDLRTELKREDYATPDQQARLEEILASEVARGQVDIRIEDGILVVEMAGQSSTATGQQGDSGRTPGSVAESGRQQGAIGESGAMTGAEVTREMMETFVRVLEAEQELEMDIRVVMPQTQPGTMDDLMAMAEMAEMTGAIQRERADDTYERIRADLSEEISRGLAEVERDGDRIVVRLADQGSFRSGSADLQPGFLPLLRRVGTAVVNTEGMISVHGHTDNVPVVFNPRFQSNWDLSAARAASVADFMIGEFQLSGPRVSVSGFADTIPIATNDTAAGRAENRRIEIIVNPT